MIRLTGDGVIVVVTDTQSNSIQCLNFAKKWFNSIFDSIVMELLIQVESENCLKSVLNRGDFELENLKY